MGVRLWRLLSCTAYACHLICPTPYANDMDVQNDAEEDGSDYEAPEGSVEDIDEIQEDEEDNDGPVLQGKKPRLDQYHFIIPLFVVVITTLTPTWALTGASIHKYNNIFRVKSQLIQVHKSSTCICIGKKDTKYCTGLVEL